MSTIIDEIKLGFEGKGLNLERLDTTKTPTTPPLDEAKHEALGVLLPNEAVVFRLYLTKKGDAQRAYRQLEQIDARNNETYAHTLSLAESLSAASRLLRELLEHALTSRLGEVGFDPKKYEIVDQHTVARLIDTRQAQLFGK